MGVYGCLCVHAVVGGGGFEVCVCTRRGCRREFAGAENTQKRRNNRERGVRVQQDKTLLNNAEGRCGAGVVPHSRQSLPGAERGVAAIPLCASRARGVSSPLRCGFSFLPSRRSDARVTTGCSACVTRARGCAWKRSRYCLARRVPTFARTEAVRELPRVSVAC